LDQEESSSLAGQVATKEHGSTGNDEPLDPPGASKQPQQEEREIAEERKDGPPASPEHKYKDEEIDLPQLDSITDGQSTALRISNQFLMTLNSHHDPGQDESPNQFGFVERACLCSSSKNIWEQDTGSTPEKHQEGKLSEDQRPFEKRWEDEELTKSLLCTEELTSS
jgi:hypothetical protein